MQTKQDWILDENGFELRNPHMLRPWYNYISNDEYGIKISHLGDAYATTLEQPRISVSNYDFFHPSKGRFLFVKDADLIWSPSFWPCKTPLDTYAARHESGITQFTASKNEILVTFSLFVPQKGTAEIWHIEVENTGTSTKEIELYPEMEFLLYNSFSVDPVYYSWYSDTRIDADRSIIFERRIGEPAIGFFAPLEKPDTFETSLKRFIGNSDISKPESIIKGTFSNAMAGGDPYIGAFQYKMSLKTGEKKQISLFAGVGLTTLENLRNQFPNSEAVSAALEKTRTTWKAKTNQGFFNSISEGTFKNWLNTFFAYQLYQQSLGMVRGTYRGFRDVAQDVMGIAKYDAQAARALLLDLGTRMYSSGQCLRQWNTEGGANDERDFRDLPFWLILALETYERYTGDSSIYTERVPYLDTKDKDIEQDTLWEHALTGIQYSLRYGAHNLLFMGAGDWNDALSGPGAEGGTTFLNQIAYLSLTTVDTIAKKHSFTHYFDIKTEKQKLYDGVMQYWNGSWFARAVTAEGKIVGDFHDTGGTDLLFSKNGRLFLLPQIWFIISGMDTHCSESKEIAKIALDTTLTRLERPEGLLKCEPGYHVFDPKAGNLSALTPGMAENFAVYNHSQAFAVYALLKAERLDDAQRLLSKVIPIKKDWTTTKAEPYVLVNFYNGGFYSEKKGEGGVPWLTGTVNWLARCFFDFPDALKNFNKSL